MSKEDFDFELAFCRSLRERAADDVPVMEMIAHYFTKAGCIEEGLQLDIRIVQLNPHSPIAHYNLACSLSLSNRNEDAVESLRAAFELGYDDFRWLHKDPDLAGLRSHPTFSALVAEYQNNA